MIRIATGLFMAMSLVGAAQAEPLEPIQARRIELGTTTGVAYYTIAEDGFRVVTTLAAGEAGEGVRFVATLAPGQSVVLSVPQALGEMSRELEIKRNNNVITVSDISAAAQPVATR